jgi:hypothetical protein
MSLASGTKLGPYEIESPLGRAETARPFGEAMTGGVTIAEGTIGEVTTTETEGFFIPHPVISPNLLT